MAALHHPFVRSSNQLIRTPTARPLRPPYRAVNTFVQACLQPRPDARPDAGAATRLLRQLLWPTVRSAAVVASGFTQSQRLEVAARSPLSAFFRDIEEELFLEYVTVAERRRLRCMTWRARAARARMCARSCVCACAHSCERVRSFAYVVFRFCLRLFLPSM